MNTVLTAWPQFRSTDLMNAVGIGRQLTAALDTFAP